MIEAGRRKIADRVSPDPPMVTLAEIDAQTVVIEPQQNDARRDETQRPGSTG